MTSKTGKEKSENGRAPRKTPERRARRAFPVFRLLALGALLAANGCAGMRKFMAIEPQLPRNTPISNPFGYSDALRPGNENIVLRTKKGDRAVEVELPGGAGQASDFHLPLSPAFSDSARSPASFGGSTYVGGWAAASSLAGLDRTEEGTLASRPPGYTDREIAATFPQTEPELDAPRRELESSLGLVPSADPTPQRDSSYLATVDWVKQLFRSGRYEAALLELDGLLRSYPTDPKIYEMRGTLLDRVGRTDLALRSWNQALRLNPRNSALRKFVERRSATPKRGLASP
jgi:tetratricopeptide (TPR) repeat protein